MPSVSPAAGRRAEDLPRGGALPLEVVVLDGHGLACSTARPRGPRDRRTRRPCPRRESGNASRSWSMASASGTSRSMAAPSLRRRDTRAPANLGREEEKEAGCPEGSRRRRRRARRAGGLRPDHAAGATDVERTGAVRALPGRQRLEHARRRAAARPALRRVSSPRSGADTRLHPDFGADDDGEPTASRTWSCRRTSRGAGHVRLRRRERPGPYPIPPNAPIEGGPDSRRRPARARASTATLRALRAVLRRPARPAAGWRAGSGAIFDLARTRCGRAGWTSADAAGLPIFPGLVRYDEVAAGEIAHALRFTVQRDARAYVAPAHALGQRERRPELPADGHARAPQGQLRHLARSRRRRASSARAQDLRHVPRRQRQRLVRLRRARRPLGRRRPRTR